MGHNFLFLFLLKKPIVYNKRSPHDSFLRPQGAVGAKGAHREAPGGRGESPKGALFSAVHKKELEDLRARLIFNHKKELEDTHKEFQSQSDTLYKQAFQKGG